MLGITLGGRRASNIVGAPLSSANLAMSPHGFALVNYKRSPLRTAPYDAVAFKKAPRQDQSSYDINDCTEWAAETTRLCAPEAGVVVVFTKEIDGGNCQRCNAVGYKVTGSDSVERKYKTDDQLIFTFFHEAAALSCCCSKKRVFVEFWISVRHTGRGRSGNVFSRDWLIPQEDAKRHCPILKQRRI